MTAQQIFSLDTDNRSLTRCLQALGTRRLFLVCDEALPHLRISAYFEHLEAQTGIKLTRFSDFSPNPKYESIVAGIQQFRHSQSDTIFAVGGGSAMDVAKCIKRWARVDDADKALWQQPLPNDIPLLVLPTTAGTGSEATRFAVIYYQGEKQSITDESCLPAYVFWDASALKTLPLYQKKATMLDALCHSIESCWSIHATPQSKRYAQQAIALILQSYPGYFAGEEAACAAMLRAAYTAGQAINITQTTAGHAMCYKLTSLYGAAHGHAAALCVAALWRWMLNHIDACADPRGQAALREAFSDLARAMDAPSAADAAEKFACLVASMGFARLPVQASDYETLIHSVNPVRLKNNPLLLSEADIAALYHIILDK